MIDTAILLTVLWAIGISAESVTAALSAGKLKFDWFGVITLACLTALGGGTIRDLLLNNYPLTWVEKPEFLLLCIVIALITTQLSFIARNFNRFFLYGDAIGLAAFAVLGAQTAMELGHGVIIGAVAAVATGVSGGVMRDILSDRIPLVFTQELYASIAIATALVYYGGMGVGVPENWVIIVSLLFAFIFRALTMGSNRGLPQFVLDESRPSDPRIRLSTSFLDRARKLNPRRSRRRRNGDN